MNLWSYFSTTDITSDKPNIDQNKVLKLSSTLKNKANDHSIESAPGWTGQTLIVKGVIQQYKYDSLSQLLQATIYHPGTRQIIFPDLIKKYDF